MRFIFPPQVHPLDKSWWAPLKAVSLVVADQPRYRFFDRHDFMMMHGVNRGRRPRVLLYKHRYTRRYLNLDDAGHAYRFIPNRDTSRSGRYVAHCDLQAALDHLDLWELPWMKPGLEMHRRGFDWEDRWSQHPDLLSEQWWNSERGDHGHVRVV